MRIIRVLLPLLLLLGLAAPAPAEAKKKILLLSQGPDGHPAETHEYAAGLRVLAKCLEKVSEVELTSVKIDEAWKEGPDLIGRADGVVLFLAEGAKWVSADPERHKAFQQLAARGGGFVALHWALGTREAAPIADYLKLLGGCHGGPDRKYKVVETEAVLANAKHPIASGLDKFHVKDEFYYQLKFVEPEGSVQPILQVDIDGAKETVAWAWERPDKGRSFGFSGLHFHNNWRLPEYRRLVAQAVLWSVKLPIPKEGLPVEVKDADLKLSDAKVEDKVKEIAGKSEFLRSVPKHFATLKAVDPVRRRVTLLIDGENVAKVWELTADAEIKVLGWWGRLDQLTVGDRVWAWFETDRAKQPTAVFMLADEISAQDIHGPGVKVEAVEGGKLTWLPGKGKSQSRAAEKAEVFKKGQSQAGPLASVAVGSQVYTQSAGDHVRLILDAGAFEERRDRQKQWLRQRWTDEGLPGSVVFLHRFTGEMELMLDHEAIRWGRSLKPGDEMTLPARPPIKAVVRQVRPWRERTQLRLVVAAADLADLGQGQRLLLRMTPPSLEVDSASLPPDLDRPRTKEERVDWFLASIYCTCLVGGDGCTGHFYTLASCNPNGCGQPKFMRRTIAERIDKGMSDKQIFEELLKEQGPDLIRPHLLP